MGWAKYYEDNVSIYDDRMYFKENKNSNIDKNNLIPNKTTNNAVIAKKEVIKRKNV